MPSWDKWRATTEVAAKEPCRDQVERDRLDRRIGAVGVDCNSSDRRRARRGLTATEPHRCLHSGCRRLRPCEPCLANGCDAGADLHDRILGHLFDELDIVDIRYLDDRRRRYVDDRLAGIHTQHHDKPNLDDDRSTNDVDSADHNSADDNSADDNTADDNHDCRTPATHLPIGRRLGALGNQ